MVFAAVCIWALATKKVHGALGRWTVVAVLAGALGNGIDRAIHGYVVDMFAFQGFLDWFPVFNVADIALVVGAVVFCLYVIFHKDALQGRRDGENPRPRPGAGGPAAPPAPGRGSRAGSRRREEGGLRQGPAQAVSRPARPAGHQNRGPPRLRRRHSPTATPRSPGPGRPGPLPSPSTAPERRAGPVRRTHA